MRLPWSPRGGREPVGIAHPTRVGRKEAREQETVTSSVSLASPPASSPSSSRLSSAEVTALRVRALQGDPLREVRDATREWVFRSLLIGKHLDEWAVQAGLTDPREIERALQRVQRWYQQRLNSYHAKRH